MHPVRTVCLLAALLAAAPALSAEPSAASNPDAGAAVTNLPVSAVTLEDYSDVVTYPDCGFNDFSGNCGAINKWEDPYGRSEIEFTDGRGALKLIWDFTITKDEGAFCGYFWSLFGQTDTQVSFDGLKVERVMFPEFSIDFDHIDNGVNEPSGPRSVQAIGIEITYSGQQKLNLKFELKDTAGQIRYARWPMSVSAGPQTFVWNIRDTNTYVNPTEFDVDLKKAKELVLVVERNNIGEQVRNPEKGELKVHRVWLQVTPPDTMPEDEAELLDLAERRAFQYFMDWYGRKPTCAGLPQDRSTYADLYTVGGVGFAIPAYVIGAERKWITKGQAAQRILTLLRTLDQPDLFGAERTGRIGYRGWYYHFLGPDGRRKMNFDFPDTVTNEALNTVEVSTIDTSVALMGMLVAQSYFNSQNPAHVEIRKHVQSILQRVEWPFMFEPGSKQYYLGWKPPEERQGPPFERLSAQSNGYYSGTTTKADTLDYYTDEALIVDLLALTAENGPPAEEIYCAWKRLRDTQGFVRTYFGSLFTFQMFHAFFDARRFLAPACPGESPVNWYNNSATAMTKARGHANLNPGKFATYGADAWGVSAAEGPFDKYHAYGIPTLAVMPQPEEDGTVTYYAMIGGAAYGEDLRAKAVSALRRAWARGHWHARFGLADAFNDDISRAAADIENRPVLRQTGAWANRTLFAVDQGLMLLHLENARSGLIWNLLAQNPNIQRALSRLSPVGNIVMEAEAATGDGTKMTRVKAVGGTSILLKSGQSRTFVFEAPEEGLYSFRVRYSNDNFGPLEKITLLVDSAPAGQFMTFNSNTGEFGEGWNYFLLSGPIGPVSLKPGRHEITVTVNDGDGYGVELDSLLADHLKEKDKAAAASP